MGVTYGQVREVIELLTDIVKELREHRRLLKQISANTDRGHF